MSIGGLGEQIGTVGPAGAAGGGSGLTPGNAPIPYSITAVSVIGIGTLSDHIGLTVDGHILAAGDILLLTQQTTASQNGPWVAAAGAWTRPPWYAHGATVFPLAVVVATGTVFGGSIWALTAPTTGITVDTTATVWRSAPTAIEYNSFVNLPSAPQFIGQLAIDTANGGLAIGYGTSAGQWAAVGGVTFSGVGLVGVGLDSVSGGHPYLAILSPSAGSGGVSNGGIVMGDITGQSGSANGVYWYDVATDGQQQFSVQVGAVGAPLVFTITSAGQVQHPGSITTAPPNSSAFTVAAATAEQNTLGYDVLVTGYVSVTSATSGATLTLGTNSTSTVTMQTLVTLPTITTPTLFAYSAIVPANYWLEISHTGTAVVGAITGIATPV